MKKIGIIVLIAVLALGALGAAYALWTQNLNINGHVDTASFHVAFATGADQPSVTAGALTLDLSGLPTAFEVTLANAKPGDGGTVSYQINNTGSIPVGAQLQYSTDGTNFNNWNGSEMDPIVNGTIVKVAVTGSAPAPATIPATTGTASGSITVTVSGVSTSPVSAISSVSFYVRVVAAQQ